MKDLNQYLQKRGDRWHYVRRVPSEYQAFDKRGTVRKSLKTESLELARKKRDELALADEQYWASLSQLGRSGLIKGTKNEALALAQQKYSEAKATAMAHGFQYRPIDELAKAQTDDILSRLSSLEINSKLNAIPAKDHVDALLGTVKRPKVLLSQAFELYCSKIAVSELIGKSNGQKRAWRKPRAKAVNTFISLNGDLPMSEITREHAKVLHDWWAERIYPDDPNAKAYAPNSGNRDIGCLSKLFRVYWEYEGEENRANPFRKLRFSDKQGEKRRPFSNVWVRQKILVPGLFDGINREAAIIVYALIETGCRPSEIANILPENILLDADVPYIRIRNTTHMQIKSSASDRDIPLVGVSLEAMKQAPKGFPRYRDKSALLSASLMKAFRAKSLFPTDEHKVYSFRHSFEDRMLEADIDYGLRCLLMGHKNSRPSYGDGGSMEYRRDQLLKIAHPFDLKIFDSF